MKRCRECELDIESKSAQTFCSRSCSAKYNNKKRTKAITIKKCKNCDNDFEIIGSAKHMLAKEYCSHDCVNQYKITNNKTIIFKQIENTGYVDHGIGITQASWLKKYLIHQYGAACSMCNWSKTNPYTKSIPVELDHIDGNPDNNHISNVRILCPNCHSLQSTHRGANVGNYKSERYKKWRGQTQ